MKRYYYVEFQNETPYTFNYILYGTQEQIFNYFLRSINKVKELHIILFKEITEDEATDLPVMDFIKTDEEE